jgi:hypothetical protein
MKHTNLNLMDYSKFSKEELIEIITNVNSILQNVETDAKEISAQYTGITLIEQKSFEVGFLIGAIRIALQKLGN